MAAKALTISTLTTGLILAPALGFSQLTPSLDFHAGYFASSRFTERNGQSATLEAIELGTSFPVFPKIPLGPGLGGIQLAFSPSIDFLGSVGSQTSKGQIYRAMLTATAPIPGTGLYGRFGAGYGYLTSGGAAYGPQSAYVIDYTLGMPIFNQIPALSVNAEITYHQSSTGQVGGWTLGLNAKF